MANGRILQIFRDGRRYEALSRIQLTTGFQANYKTLEIMGKIVREDAVLPDLKAFAIRTIIGVDNAKTTERGINAAYEFCRDRIEYTDEADGYETVADLWSCLYGLNPDKAVGDCAIKSVALATLLCYLNLRPVFVAFQQIPGADFFNHVAVGLVGENGTQVLDATPPEFGPGDSVESLHRVNYGFLR